MTWEAAMRWALVRAKGDQRKYRVIAYRTESGWAYTYFPLGLQEEL